MNASLPESGPGRTVAVALMYHDVMPPGFEDASGFPGGDAARYKLTPLQFDAHLDSIAGVVAHRPVVADPSNEQAPVLLTFDDGGVSAVECVADRLERRGWRGYFFVTGAYVDRRGFLSRSQIRDLRKRGHSIGSHSQSHPLRMARCSGERLRREWSASVALLSDVLGEPVVTASVPGGSCSRAVADSAMAAGVRFLFTSEPTTRRQPQAGGTVIGRFAVHRSMRPATVSALLEGTGLARWQQLAAWRMKSAAKTVGGASYLSFRDRLLGGGQVRWGEELADTSEDPS